jgi:hypothetical protein
MNYELTKIIHDFKYPEMLEHILGKGNFVLQLLFFIKDISTPIKIIR